MTVIVSNLNSTFLNLHFVTFSPPICPLPQGTPAVFSTRTSLSGLDFDDEKEKEAVEEGKEEQEDGAAKSANSTLSEDEDIYADSESLLGQLITSAMPAEKAAPRSRLPKPRTAWAPRPPLPEQEAWAPRPEQEAANSDDSCCSGEHGDLLADCIASAMPGPLPAARPSIPRLGPRQAAEGAPAPEPRLARRKARSPGAHPAPSSRPPPPPPERKGSHLSHPCVAAAAASQDDFRALRAAREQRPAPPQDTVRCWGVEDTPLNFSTATSLSSLNVDDTAPPSRGAGPVSGKDTPREWRTEDTPAVFSRNDSLSSLEYETEDRRGEMGKGQIG